MRKKLETLPLSELKAIAKENHLKNVSTLRKAELIDALCALHEAKKVETVVSSEAKETITVSDEPPKAPATEAPVKNEAVQEKVSAPVVGTQAAEGEQRRPREYRPRNSEFVQRAGGMQRRPQQMRPMGSRPQRMYDGAQRVDRNSQPAENVQPKESVQSAEGTQPENIGVAMNETTTAAPTIQEPIRTEPTVAAEETQTTQVKENSEPIGENGEVRDDLQALDSGIVAQGILEVMPDGFGFIRSANYMPGDEDVYVAPSQIRRFNLKTGDVVNGNRRIKSSGEKFAALLYVNHVNGFPPAVIQKRPNFEDLTPIFPNKRLHLERPGGTRAMRIVDLLSPIGKGQRGMIVSPPKAGKTTLLKDVAKAITANHPDMHLIILLIDERPEEVTDIKESIEGDSVEVIYSTFDELPEHHKRVSEMVLERAKRLVEHGRDVMILLDSITRLARAYNLTVAPSGRTLSGGLDPAALYMPKRFFGAARNMREGGSLTVLATALVDTGSRMDDVVFEEFKGTGNMELALNRKLSEKRIFPAIDIQKSGTRRDDLLLTPEERATADLIHKVVGESRGDEPVERVLNLFSQTKTNREFIAMSGKLKFSN